MPKQRTVKRGRGRPPRQIPLHMARIRMDKPMWDALEAVASAQGTTASEVLRRCAARYITRHRGRIAKG